MEPIDLARAAAVLFILVALGSALVIAVVLLRTRPARLSQARAVAPPPRAQPVARRKPRPPRPIPQLADEDMEAMSAEERSILTAANTLKSLPSDLQNVLWAACVPHVFEFSLLSALLPDQRGRLKELYDSVQRVWFVEVTPGGHYHLQAPIRRSMIRHLNKPVHYEEFFQRSLRATKYFYQAMIGGAPSRGSFVSETFFRFLPDTEARPAPQIEWLYHLVVVDPDHAARALRQVGDRWLAQEQFDPLQKLMEVLAEHLEDGRATPPLRALIYYYQGRLALQQRRSPEALDRLEQARVNAAGDPLLRDDILKAVGVGLQDLHAVQSGLRPNQSAAAAQPAPPRRQWVMWDEMQLPDPREDLITRYEERLELYRARRDQAGMGYVMTLIAEEHLFRADYRAALQWYQDALKVYQEAGAVSGRPLLDEALTRKHIGDMYCALRRFEEARAHYQAALARLQETAGDGAPLQRADLFKAMADMLRQVGQYEEALPEYERARQLYHNAGAQSSEADVLLAEGEAFHAQGNLSEAQQHFDEALQTYRSAGSQTGRAQALLVLGGMTQQRGSYQDALQQYEQAREIYRMEKNRSGEASALRAMGDAHARRGEWDQALQAYQDAVEYYQAAGARAGRAHTLIAIGDVYRRQQQYEAALKQYQWALQEFRTLQDVQGEANTLVALAVVQSLQQHGEEALKLFDEAETLYRQVSDRSGEARARRFKGEEYLLENKFDLALTEFQEAIKVAEGYGGDRATLEELWTRVGYTQAISQLTAEGPHPHQAAALQAYDQAIRIGSQRKPGWDGYHALVDGQFDAAEAYFKVIVRREPDIVLWQIGLTMAKFGLAGDQTEPVERSRLIQEAAWIVSDQLRRANAAEQAEACHWRDYVMSLRPDLRMHWGELGLKC